jgi:cell division protein FtsW
VDNQIQDSRLTNAISMVVIILMAVGTVMVFSAGANVSQSLDLKRFYDFSTVRQIVFFPLAVAVMFTASRVDYHRFSFPDFADGGQKKWSLRVLFKFPLVYLLILSIGLLILVLSPLGAEVNYARRWLRIPVGPTYISFQPSELAKWSVVIFLAAFCGRYAGLVRSLGRGFVPVCLLIAVIVGLIVVEDFGTAVFICLLTGAMLLIGGAKVWHLLTPVPFAGALFYYMLISSPRRLERIAAYLQPEKWAQSAAYQARESLAAIGSGGIWGKGLGRGICKYGHLPEDTTDFIFAIIGEELGFVGTAMLICLFIAFVLLGLKVALRSNDRLGRLLAVGIVMTVGLQAAINIGVATVILPTKGIPLPFVSAGGTSMLLSAAAVGILLNIAKQGRPGIRAAAGTKEPT